MLISIDAASAPEFLEQDGVFAVKQERKSSSEVFPWQKCKNITSTCRKGRWDDKQDETLSLATANEASGDGTAVVRPLISFTVYLKTAGTVEVASHQKERNLTL